MKRIARLPILAACLGVLMLCHPAISAEAEPKVGLMLGDAPFSAPITAEDAAYLGLSGQTDFTLKDIKAPYVLIESLNST
jgi:hypothetical protein